MMVVVALIAYGAECNEVTRMTLTTMVSIMLTAVVPILTDVLAAVEVMMGSPIGIEAIMALVASSTLFLCF